MEPRLSADFKPQPDDVEPDVTLDSRVIMKGNTTVKQFWCIKMTFSCQCNIRISISLRGLGI